MKGLKGPAPYPPSKEQVSILTDETRLATSRVTGEAGGDDPPYRLRSTEVKEGYPRAANRALLRSLGITDREFGLPFIGIAMPGILSSRGIPISVPSREGP